MSALRPNRELWLWRGLGTAALLLALLAWGTSVSGPKVVQAQPLAGARVQYRQAEANYRHTAETVAEWEAKGWETFQVVPGYPPNPRVGTPMTVAIIFRRPEK